MTQNSLMDDADDTNLPSSPAEELAKEPQAAHEEATTSNAPSEDSFTDSPDREMDESNSSVEGQTQAENTAKIPNDADFAGETADASASEGDNSEPTTAQAETDKTPPTSPETPPKTPETAHQAAVRFALAGRSIVPVNPLDKRPFGSWKPAQIAAATAEDIHRWPLDRRDSFARFAAKFRVAWTSKMPCYIFLASILTLPVFTKLFALKSAL